MTREEAREFIINLSYKLGNMSVEYLSEKDGEKMREAIKALEQEPTTKNDLGVDCIKKSDAIDIVQDMHGLARADVISDAVNRIISMPSVTPQEPKVGE